MTIAEFTLGYHGSYASEHQLDFYDASVALIGFQRSLALTTHLVLTGEVITQAPSLKGAQILVRPPKAGSWEVIAVLVAAAGVAFKLGTAPRDTVIGNLVSSAYDYVVSQALGFHVDYNKTLGQQYEELQASGSAIPRLKKSKFESTIEKCETAIRDMHRPIMFSGTADSAHISTNRRAYENQFGYELSPVSYENLLLGHPAERPQKYLGRVSSYNINTFKGRLFVDAVQRPVPFEIPYDKRDPRLVSAVTRSLAFNSRGHKERATIELVARPYEGRTGILRHLSVVSLVNDLDDIA